MALSPITAKASLDATNFTAGVQEIKKRLSELNAAYETNKAEMKQLGTEMNKLEREKRKLIEQMKNGGTEEQQKELEALNDELTKVADQLGVLRVKESDLKSELKSTTRALEDEKKAVANASSENTQFITTSDSAADALHRLETGLKAVIAGAAGKKLYEVLIGSNAEMEQYLTSFEVMLGDAEKAQTMMNELNKMAAETPMELTDVISAGTLLMNYGVEAENLIGTMTQLGDLAAGNAQKFERVSVAYGQMLAKGKVTGEEMRQMTEAGVPLLQALADNIGVSTSEVQKLISAGKVGIPELNAAIEDLTTGTGQFAGMMEKQAQTFQGMLSTLSDEVAQFGRQAGEESFEILKESLADIMKMIDQWKADGTLEDIAKGTGSTVGFVVNSLKTVIQVLVDCRGAIVPLVTAITTYKVAVEGLKAVNWIVTSVQKLAAGFDANRVALLRSIGVTNAQTVAEKNLAAATQQTAAAEAALIALQASGTATESQLAAAEASLATARAAEAAATKQAEASQIALNAAQAANPIGLILAALGGLIALLVQFSGTADSATENIKKLNDEAKQLSQEAEDYSQKAASLDKIKKKYEEIEKSEKDTKTKATELKGIQDDLISQFRTLAGQIDLVNGRWE